MQEIYILVIGGILLLLGIPIGDILAKVTKEELEQGKKWFKLLIIASLILSVIFLILKKDDLFFTMLFIAIVTSRSLNIRKENKKISRRQKKGKK